MSRCSDCQNISFTGSRLEAVLFKKDLASLIESAKDGCSFCNMCWHQIQASSDSEHIESSLKAARRNNSDRDVDLGIYLRSTLTDADHFKHFLASNSPAFSSCSLRFFSGEVLDDVDNLFWNAKLSAELPVFADSGNLAARYIRGRNFTSASNCDDYITWAKACLLECESDHWNCLASTDVEMPTRVIDLGLPGARATPYVLETRGKLGKYMTLSYCWGDGVKPQIRLKTSTYAAMVQGFDEQLLTKTHQEALFLARALGYQYVWIDALCIIQDDARDWEIESSQMAACYQSAKLNLIAGRSGNSLNGFMENHFTPALLPVRFDFTSDEAPGQIGDVYACLPRSVDTGPVENRAWCYQEEVLSRRSFTFGVEMLIVSCQEKTYLESGGITDRTQVRLNDLPEFVGIFDDPHTTKEEVLRRWYHTLARYTKCDLFEPHDIFAALMGLATIVRNRLQSRYLAGLWEDDLIRGLLWQSTHDTYGETALFPALARPKERNPKKSNVLGRPAVRAPSWSWASVEGPVEHATYHQQLGDEEMFAKHPTSLCVRPALQNPTRWTSSTNCSVDKASMPVCELEMFGSPVLVQRSTAPILTEKFKRDTRWRFAGARVAKFAVLCSSLSPQHRVGMGLFDVQSEQTDSLWCMRLIKDRGLMLHMDQVGKFHRLGKFVVLDRGWFEKQPERKVFLV